jgi:hypothetical protein
MKLRCISILAQLNSNTDEIFDIEKDQRTALIKAAGMFSRQIETNFPDEKDGRLVAKRKKKKQDKTARKETGIRHAREASVFMAQNYWLLMILR